MVAAANNVSKFREALGLSREDLAARLQCEIRLVQYIEAGMMTRLSVAMHVANILGKPIGVVFPALKKPLKALGGKSYLEARNDDLDLKFEDAGIDPDPYLHTFRFVLRNGLERCVELASAESARLCRNLQRPPASFVNFQTATDCIALNVKYLALWQFVSELAPARMLTDSNHDPQLEIWIGAAKEAIRFDVEPDPAEFGTEGADDIAILQMIFFQLEHCWEDDEIFHVRDDDGNTIFFRADNVSMISLPLEAVRPDLWDALCEV